jgi:nucleoid DNA-binding protein
MRKSELARKLPRRLRTTNIEAADELDHAVSEVLQKLRHGSVARLPGVGTISPDKSKNWTFEPEKQ